MPVPSLPNGPGDFSPLRDDLYLSDSNSLWDQLKGQTSEHAEPPRLEDEGQSGG
jgi:hypothetical protein